MNMNNLKYPPKKFGSQNPFLLIGRSYLLVDDVVHGGVNKGADYLTGKNHNAKKNLGYVLAAATAFIPAPSSLNQDSPIMSMLVLGGSNIAVVHYALKESQASNGSKTLNFAEFICKVFRLPYLLLSIPNLYIGIIEESNKNLNSFLFSALTACAFYLASSSNGMLDRFKNFVQELNMPALKSIPVKIK